MVLNPPPDLPEGGEEDDTTCPDSDNACNANNCNGNALKLCTTPPDAGCKPQFLLFIYHSGKHANLEFFLDQVPVKRKPALRVTKNRIVQTRCALEKMGNAQRGIIKTASAKQRKTNAQPETTNYSAVCVEVVMGMRSVKG